MNTLYISAARISKDQKGVEYISHARVHKSVSRIIKRQGTVYAKSLILDMMQSYTFFTVIWDRHKNDWLIGAMVLPYTDPDGEQYIVTNSSDKTDLYSIKSC